MMDELDRKIVVVTQGGLPLTLTPYEDVAKAVDMDAAEVIARMKKMLDTGIIRRIGVVANHYALGYKGNGMTVWDVPDDRIQEVGKKIGTLDYVSHCYHRPRHLPHWPYNLFCMVHGKDRESVEVQTAQIAEILGEDSRAHRILFSTRILKKSGLRLVA